ncbi:MAG: pseudouridine synthase [Pseudomonadales bacterium]|nr:pseudouridine synthase [Pseudomonadales bacterium]
MRIDQFLSQTLNLSRKQSKVLISKKQIRINSELVKKSQQQVGLNDVVLFNGAVLNWPGESYWMLNKPANYCCSHIDDGYPSVFKLLPDSKNKLHIAGRLDANTTGLLLLSSDGQWCHKITSPKQKKTKFKLYHVGLAERLSKADISQLEDGILLRGETHNTLDAQITIIDEQHCTIAIQEGRYHQIKRMFAAIGNRVTSLHRQKISSLCLDPQLAPGDFRALTEKEIEIF